MNDLNRKKEETSPLKVDQASEPFNRGLKRTSSRLDSFLPTDFRTSIRKNVESY